jgi:hypothetical protein
MELWEDLIQYSLNKPGKQFILNVVYNFNKWHFCIWFYSWLGKVKT